MFYDFYGNEIATVYDFYGNPITSKQMLSVTDGTYQQTWDVRKNALETNARSVLSEMFTDGSSVEMPIYFVVSTDQHSAVEYEAMRMMHNLDVSNQIKIINLGDCMPSAWNQDIADYVFSRTKDIENYISVVGNHDAHNFSDITTNGYSTDEKLKNLFFSSDEGANYPHDRDVDYYSVVDSKCDVKYLVLCPYYMPDDGTDRSLVKIGKNQMDWLINELNHDDMDVIIIMHQIFTDENIHRDGTIQDWHDAPTVLKNVRAMLEAYNSRTIGNIADSDGIVHNYDFSNCGKKILVTLHGHSHEELFLVKNNLTTYVANWHRDFLLTCGMIDRSRNKVKLYPFNYLEVKEPLELNI